MHQANRDLRSLVIRQPVGVVARWLPGIILSPLMTGTGSGWQLAVRCRQATCAAPLPWIGAAIVGESGLQWSVNVIPGTSAWLERMLTNPHTA